MSPKITNPFIISGPIPEPYFCDRIKETQTLISHIQNGRNVLLLSQRRVGKTGLINHCFAQPEIENDNYTFFIDILGTRDLRDFTYAVGREIFEKLKPAGRKMLDQFLTTVRSISNELGYDAVTGLPKFTLSLGALRNPSYTLSEIFDYLNQADKHCIIAIDEFQQIANYPEKNIEALLRTHIQHCANANFIFAGSERHILNEMFHLTSRPFYASTTEMNLLELTVDSYREFSQNLFREFGKDITTEAIHQLYDMFEGNTYCMQKTMNELFAMSKNGSESTFSEVRTAISCILSENERSYRNRLSLLAPKPKELLLAIAQEGKAERITSGAFVKRHQLTSASSVQSAIKQLMSGDWITYEGDETGNKRYFITDRFFSLYLREKFGGESLFM